MGIITNGKLDIQLARLDAMGLGGRFEHVIASSELGIAKPAPEIFLHACEVFEVSPGEAAYVGDRLHIDAIAAAAAGMLGVWLDRNGSATPSDRALAEAHGAAIISGLNELPRLLG